MLGCPPEDLSLLRWNPVVCCRDCYIQHQASTDVVLPIVLQQIEDIVPHLIKQDRSETFRAAVARMKASSGAGSRPSQTGPTASKVGARAAVHVETNVVLAIDIKLSAISAQSDKGAANKVMGECHVIWTTSPRLARHDALGHQHSAETGATAAVVAFLCHHALASGSPAACTAGAFAHPSSI